MSAKRAKPDDAELLPDEPIQKVVKPVVKFLYVEAASGVVLLLATAMALFLANSPWSSEFLQFWKTPLGLEVGEFQLRHSLQHWINDALMAIFFFVIGLEVKREIAVGELREFNKAILPVAAAIGGMIFPAGIYLALQWGEPTSRGWGIPMATDIAFVVGCMAVLGSRIPHGLRVLILTLAIADDIGAILVIAIGYTEELHFNWLLVGAGAIVVVLISSRLGIRSFLVYGIIGVVVWFGFHESGVHATIAGVILGLLTPAKRYLPEGLFGQLLNRAQDLLHGNWESESERTAEIRAVRKATREVVSPLEYLENRLHPWVSFGVMPLFAFANAGVKIELEDLGSAVSIAIVLGLVVGKPAGVFLLSWLAVKPGWAKLPSGVTWPILFAGGCLAGIGFTMALFIAGLALSGDDLDVAKVGVLAGSLVSAVLGMVLLLILSRPEPHD